MTSSLFHWHATYSHPTYLIVVSMAAAGLTVLPATLSSPEHPLIFLVDHDFIIPSILHNRVPIWDISSRGIAASKLEWVEISLEGPEGLAAATGIRLFSTSKTHGILVSSNIVRYLAKYCWTLQPQLAGSGWFMM